MDINMRYILGWIEIYDEAGIKSYYNPSTDTTSTAAPADLSILPSTKLFPVKEWSHVRGVFTMKDEFPITADLRVLGEQCNNKNMFQCNYKN